MISLRPCQKIYCKIFAWIVWNCIDCVSRVCGAAENFRWKTEGLASLVAHPPRDLQHATPWRLGLPVHDSIDTILAFFFSYIKPWSRSIHLCVSRVVSYFQFNVLFYFYFFTCPFFFVLKITLDPIPSSSWLTSRLIQSFLINDHWHFAPP